MIHSWKCYKLIKLCAAEYYGICVWLFWVLRQKIACEILIIIIQIIIFETSGETFCREPKYFHVCVFASMFHDNSHKKILLSCNYVGILMKHKFLNFGYFSIVYIRLKKIEHFVLRNNAYLMVTQFSNFTNHWKKVEFW